jgi:hypothetical protein
MGEDGRAVALDVLSEQDPGRGLGDQPLEPRLAGIKGSRPLVLAVELQ